MTIKQAIAKLNRIINTIENEIPNILKVEAGEDLAALIVNRVQQTQKDSKGSLFSRYNPGYARKAKKTVRHKDFTLTGEMWQKFGVTNFRKTFDGAKIELGGKNKDSQDKIDINSEREGQDITEPSDREIEIIQEAIEERINKLINKTWGR